MSINKKIISLLILSVGTLWIFLNIFFTPFYIWSEGIYRPWLFLNGFVLFRDIMWLRASFDLYLLAVFYKLFGVNPLNFQIFIFASQALIGIVMFLLLIKKSRLLAITAYAIYSLSAFLVYGTINQPAEILIGLFVFLVFYFYWQFIDKKNSKFLFFAGIATGFSLITKQTSLFIPFSVLLLLVIFSRKKLIRESIFYLSGTFIPVLIYAGYFALNNGLYDLYLNTIYNVWVFYPKTQDVSLYPVDFSEAIKIIVLHLAALVPFIFIKTDKIFPKPVKIALILFVLSLFTTLLPAFLSYRLISALPIFSVMTASFLMLGYSVLRQRKQLVAKIIIIVGSITFLFLFAMYSNQSFKYIVENGGFTKQDYRMSDYSKNEENVALWLKNNTDEKERVFGIGNVLIMFYANRFPQNKYSDSFVFEYLPIDSYYEAITENPAKIVVFDSNTPTSLKNLKNWKYVRFLKENYTLIKTFVPYEIYLLNRGSTL